MANVDKLQKRVTVLQEEQTALQAAIADLETGRAAKHQALTALWAAAERTPTDESTRAADHAEREHDALGRQVERKRAALEACAGDLDAAQTALDVAQCAAVVDELQGLVQQVEETARRIDANIADATSWGKLQALVQQVNQTYWLGLGSAGYGNFRVIFPDPPAKMRERVYAYHARCCDAAMNDHMGVDVKPARVVDLLGLDRAQGRLRLLLP